MPNINFQRTYPLSEDYEGIKKRATPKLGKYLDQCLYPNLITFNDADRSVTFKSERLIPTASTSRPRIMLLFSNPHPYSVHQGMFLSQNTKGRENLFWPTMREAKWICTEEENPNPKKLAEICVQVKYDGPFELIFYCYYAFPTADPKDIRKIFGKDYFNQFIEPKAVGEFSKTIQETSVKAVVTFNKEIFNIVSQDQTENYIQRLKEGELIKSQIKGINRYTPIFLTFPTGWRFDKEYRKFRKASLETIETDICQESKKSAKNNT